MRKIEVFEAKFKNAENKKNVHDLSTIFGGEFGIDKWTFGENKSETTLKGVEI